MRTAYELVGVENDLSNVDRADIHHHTILFKGQTAKGFLNSAALYIFHILVCLC